MKSRVLGILMALLSLALCLIPAPVRAVTLTIAPTSGPVDTLVTIYALNSYGQGDYAIYWGETKQLLKQGAVEGFSTTTFSVPESPRGINKLYLKVGANNYDAEFRVTPGITVSPNNGIVDTAVTVSGRGFNALESNIQITYDVGVIDSGIGSDNRGSWKRTFKIPPSRSGKHVIDASGSTPAIEVDDQTFTVIPKIDILPISGGVDTMVTVAGTGFSSSETGITLTYDSTVVKASIASDGSGTWKSSFFVPRSTQGRHLVNAYGSVTKSTEVENISFSVSPSIKIEMATGHLGDVIHPGDALWVSGIGFQENETGVKVTFDGTMLTSGLIADAKGSWATKLDLPQCMSGEHSINSSGDVTRAGDIPNAVLVISPLLEISPVAGAIGETVTTKGSGFSGNQPISISYDGTPAATGINSDVKGGFSTNFKIPASKAGNHTITVADARSVTSVKFTVESSPPPTPNPLAPLPGTSFGFTDKPASFEWSAVIDPSGVTYQMEISKSADFTGTALRKANLLQPKYTLEKNESLPSGTYYWRVKAVDGAGNESTWSGGQLIKIASIDLWMILGALAAIIIIGLIIWRVVHISKRSGWG